jgi:hypothetical protein
VRQSEAATHHGCTIRIYQSNFQGRRITTKIAINRLCQRESQKCPSPSKQPLPLKEHGEVRVTIHSAMSLTQESYGLLRWKGDLETLRQIAEDDEFSILETA